MSGSKQVSLKDFVKSRSKVNVSDVGEEFGFKLLDLRRRVSRTGSVSLQQQLR